MSTVENSFNRCEFLTMEIDTNHSNAARTIRRFRVIETLHP